MNKFSEHLQAILEETWNKNIRTSKMWTGAIVGTMNRNHYAAFLRETFHYTKQSPLIQASAIPHFQKNNRDLVKPFLSHAHEEEWHYKLCAKDLQNLGYSEQELEKSNPLPATEGYIGFAINRISFVNPLAYLGYLYNLEYMAIRLGPEFIGMVSKQLGLQKNQLSFFMAHVEEDTDHVKDLSELVDKFVTKAEDQDEVIYTAKTASALYRGMIDAAYENPWLKENSL